MLNLKALKEAARTASDGPWFVKNGWEVWIGEEGSDAVHLTTAPPGDASYIALANPSTILSLIERCEELSEAVREAQLQIVYLHEKLGFETGSGNGVIARLGHVLSKADATS